MLLKLGQTGTSRCSLVLVVNIGLEVDVCRTCNILCPAPSEYGTQLTRCGYYSQMVRRVRRRLAQVYGRTLLTADPRDTPEDAV